MLAECCLYLATAPKSNSTLSYFQAYSHVQNEQTKDVPNHLKDSNRDKEGFGHGKGYKYPHAFQEHYTPQQYLPDAMQGTYFYEPNEIGYEKEVAARMATHRVRDEEEDLMRRVKRYGESD